MSGCFLVSSKLNSMDLGGLRNGGYIVKGGAWCVQQVTFAQSGPVDLVPTP